jgi:hypothetical protein
MPSPNMLALSTSRWCERGWIGDGCTPLTASPQRIPANQATISNSACDHYPYADQARWNEARARCAREGYRQVRLYIDLRPPTGTRESIEEFLYGNDVTALSRQDAWRSGGPLESSEGSVAVLRPPTDRSPGSQLVWLRDQIRDLAMSCQLVSFAYVESHGTPGALMIHGAGQTQAVHLPAFLAATLRSCALAPGASIQFGGCFLGCGTGDPMIRAGLEAVYREPFRGSTGPNPSSTGVRLLMATGISLMHVGTSGRRGVTSSDRNGVEYTIGQDGVQPDGPIPACPAPGSSFPDGSGGNLTLSPSLYTLEHIRSERFSRPYDMLGDPYR